MTPFFFQTQARDFILVNVLLFPLVWFTSVYINLWLKTIGLIKHSEALAHAMAIPTPILATFLFYKFVAFKVSVLTQFDGKFLTINDGYPLTKKHNIHAVFRFTT